MFCIGFPLPLLRQVARGPLAEALRHYDPLQLVETLLQAAPPDEVGPVNAMRHLDFTLSLPGDMLVKIDRASMAVSLEVRPLFLHRDVMELAAGLPPASLASHSAAKIALKEAVRPWLPGALVDRRKQGFALPLPEWLAQDSVLAANVRRARSSGPLAELLDMRRVSELSADQARGTGSLTAIVYSAFVLDQWFAKWMRP
jgi:asparagine synthase (glutamine-hydrolysing)